MKLIFMGTPEFAVASLEKLIEAGHTIVKVLTQPDKPVGRRQVMTAPPVRVFAEKRGLEVLQPSRIKTTEARQEFEPLFKSVDACIVAAYGRILPEWMLEAPRFGAINVHSSLLPKYRGAAPINWAIAQGERETGVTIMQMDAGLDTGPIFRQRSTPIGEDETAAGLTPRLAQIGAELLVETLELLERGELTPIAQNDAEATPAPMLKREDGEVNWNLTAEEIYNRLRGFTPFPGCYTTIDGRRLEIVKARPESPHQPAVEAGTVCEVTRDQFVVACRAGTLLRVFEVQPEGKRAMPVRDFLNGTKLTAGTRLGAR